MNFLLLLSIAGYGVKAFDPLDTKAARAATAKYLKNMQKYHGFTPEETLRAYNWGPGNVINYNKGNPKDIPAEALNYPGKILGFENVEGVNVPYEMPVPTPRPREDMSQDPGMWDQFKALFKENGGDAILRDNPEVLLLIILQVYMMYLILMLYLRLNQVDM